MSRLLTSVAAATLFSTAAVAADLPVPMDPIPEAVVAPGHQWFISGFGGWSTFHDDYEFDFISGAGAAFSYEVSMDDGFAAGGGAGMIVNDWLRVGVEVAYSRYDFGDDYVGTTTGFVGAGESGDLQMVTGVAAAWVNGNLGWVQPYVGGGVGGAWVDADLSITNGAGDQIDGDDFGLAAMGGAGLRIPIGSWAELDLGYRFRGVFDINIDSAIAGFTTSDVDIYTHTAQGGINIKF